ncbi:hypothetical protein WJX77_001817 [Trebouxia sp. C0004]
MKTANSNALSQSAQIWLLCTTASDSLCGVECPLTLKQEWLGRLKVQARSSKGSFVWVSQGTSLMDEVFINQEADPYVLEVDGTLDLAALQLQPGTIVINSKKGLVDVQTSKTKRTFADIQQKVLHDTTAGSMANPLHISGAPIAGLDTGDSKLDQILSLLKAKTNPKARPISEVGSAEADSVLLELGFLQDDGNEVDPIVVPAGLSMCHSFDYSQFPSEDDGTPALLQHHQQQLSGFEVQFGRSQFQMYDIHHRKDLKLTLPSGVSYIGGLDGVAAPWGLAKAGAVSEMRIAYEHKQSIAQKQAHQEANPQYYEGKVSKSGGEDTIFVGRRKGQSIGRMKKDRAEISRTGQPRGVASMPAQMMAKPMSLAAYGGGGAKALDEKVRQRSLGVDVYGSEDL